MTKLKFWSYKGDDYKTTNNQSTRLIPLFRPLRNGEGWGEAGLGGRSINFKQ